MAEYQIFNPGDLVVANFPEGNLKGSVAEVIRRCAPYDVYVVKVLCSKAKPVNWIEFNSERETYLHADYLIKLPKVRR